MSRTAAVVRVPGEEAPLVAEETTSPVDEQVSVPKSTLEMLLAKVASLEAKVSAAPAKRGPKVDPDLPDQKDVDPNKIKSSVLTKQGWQVPAGYGSFPGQTKV